MRRPIRHYNSWIPGSELTLARGSERRVRRASAEGAEADQWAALVTGAHVTVAWRGHPSGRG
jgi:hypothetical protein